MKRLKMASKKPNRNIRAIETISKVDRRRMSKEIAANTENGYYSILFK